MMQSDVWRDDGAVIQHGKGTKLFGASVCTVGALILMAAASELAYEAMEWLKSGIWPHLRLAYLWFQMGGVHPHLDWEGLQTIVMWVLSWPVSVGLIVTGLAISFVGRRFES